LVKATGLLIRELVSFSGIGQSMDQGQSIEKVLQKYEAEIRAHVKVEQEFKKMAEEADDRVEKLKNHQLILEDKCQRLEKQLMESRAMNHKLMKQLNEDIKINKSVKKDGQGLRIRLEKLQEIEAPMSGTHSSLCMPINKKKTDLTSKNNDINIEMNCLNIKKHTKNSFFIRIGLQCR